MRQAGPWLTKDEYSVGSGVGTGGSSGGGLVRGPGLEGASGAVLVGRSGPGPGDTAVHELTDCALEQVSGGSGDEGYCQIEVNFPTALDSARYSAPGLSPIDSGQYLPEIWLPSLQ